MTATERIIKICEFLKSSRCKNVATFDLTENGEPKFFVVASATNPDENKKVADELCKKFQLDGERDGYHKGEWIILCFSNIYVHLFTLAARSRYNLDRLYKSKEIDLAKFLKKKKSK